MFAFSSVPATSTETPECSLQIILLTYQSRVLADDIFQSAASLALRVPGLQLVVAWGGEDGARQRQWEHDVAHCRSQGGDVVLISHPSPLERVKRALAQSKEWILPLADDDPIAVNYLRAMAAASVLAGSDVSAILPSNQVQNCDTQTYSRRHAGWNQPDATSRVLDMLARPGQQGTLFWAVYRHSVMVEWLAFAQNLPYQPSYLDQFLPHLAALRGRLDVAAEETIALKDERHWQSDEASAQTNARYCPHADMALYHEWFWAADLWHLVGGRQAGVQVASAMKGWSAQMIGHLLDTFEARRRLLKLQLSPAHIQIMEGMQRACGWVFEPDSGQDPVRGMSLLATAAHALRARWVAEGQAPLNAASLLSESMQVLVENT